MASNFPFTSALVTGASSGIGEAMAELLGEAGIPTVVVARRKDRLQELAARFATIEVIVADLGRAKGLAAVVARIEDEAAPIDLVVNNAGFGTSGDFHTLDADRLDAEVQLNVAALTRLSRAALGAMVPRGRGFLLNVSSVASFQPAPKLAVYAATKAYVTSLTESLHEETRGTGVNVTALCPGLTRTEFRASAARRATPRSTRRSHGWRRQRSPVPASMMSPRARRSPSRVCSTRGWSPPRGSPLVAWRGASAASCSATEGHFFGLLDWP